MAYTFTRTGAQIEEIHNTVDDPKSNAQFSDDIRTIAGEYRGLWPDTGGSANKGDTYQTQVSGTPTGQYFTALQNTTVDPVSDDVNWREAVSVDSFSKYTDIVFKASGDNSAVENMLSDLNLNPIMYAVGTIIKTGGTTWEYKDSTGQITLDNFRAFSDYCVLDFGVVGGGVDTSANMQKAINAANEHSANLFFPKDVYTATGLRTTSDVSFHLNGSTIIKPDTPEAAATFLLTLVNSSSTATFNLTNGVIDGANNGESFYHLVRLENENCHVNIENMIIGRNNKLSGGVRVAATETDAILVTRAGKFTLKDSKIFDVCRNGISFIDGNCKNSVIENNEFEDCGLTGIDYEPNTTIDNQFEYVSIIGNKFIRCWDKVVWPSVLGGCVTMLNKPSDTYTLCDTFTAKDNIFDCTHDTPTGSLTGELIIALRTEGVRRAITKGNKFFNSQYLHGAAANIDLELIEASLNEYVNTQVAIFKTRRIVTGPNTYRNELARAVYQADTSDDKGEVSSIHETFRSAGDNTMPEMMNIKAGRIATFDHLIISDSRPSSELPLSIFGSFSSGSVISLTTPNITGQYLDIVRPDSRIGILKVSAGGEVKGAVNFMRNATTIDNAKIYDSEFVLTGKFIEDLNGGVATGLVVNGNDITAEFGVSGEVINNSSIKGNKFNCSTQAIGSYSNTTAAVNTFIRNNDIIGTSASPIDFFGDTSSFVGNNWMYNCAPLSPLGVSDAGGNIERP